MVDIGGSTESSMVNSYEFKMAQNEISLEDRILTKERSKALIDCLEILSLQEKFIIVHLYGIGGELIMTQKEIAKSLLLTQPVVSKLKKVSLEKLRMVIMQLMKAGKW